MQEIKLDKIQRRKFASLKLTIDLVPRSCWWSNVRTHLTRTQWDKIRTQICRLADNKCEICGGTGTSHLVECHEIWEYDQQEKVQTLKKIIAVCPSCHQTKHIGRTRNFNIELWDQAYKRFQNINELTDSETELFHDYFWQQWEERSGMEWQFDITLLNQYNIDLDRTRYTEIDRKYFSTTNKYLPTKSSLVKIKPIRGRANTFAEYVIDECDFKCPFCESKTFIKQGNTVNKFRYRCNSCGKGFTSTIDTSAKKELLKTISDML